MTRSYHDFREFERDEIRRYDRSGVSVSDLLDDSFEDLLPEQEEAGWALSDGTGDDDG